MELFLNNEKKGNIELDPHITLGQLKKNLLKWSSQNKLGEINIQIIFNNGEELAPIVFTTDKYDKFNFLDKKDLVKGGKILINQIKENKIQQIQEIQNTKFTGMKDVDLLILSKLEDFDLINICNTNSYLRKLCNEDFWQKRFIEKHPYFINKQNKKWKELYLGELIGYNKYRDGTSVRTYIARHEIRPSDQIVEVNIDIQAKSKNKYLYAVITGENRETISSYFSSESAVKKYAKENGYKLTGKYLLSRTLFYPDI
jgi:hypothetical protein